MPLPHSHRLRAFDMARGAAIILMIVAHTAPSDGPARIFLTSEFLTAPLFAMLVGSGIELSAHRRATGATRPDSARTLNPASADGEPVDPSNFSWWPRFALTQAIRAAILFILGWILAGIYGSIFVVLGALAFLTIVLTLVAPAPTWAKALLAPIAIVGSVWAAAQVGYGTLTVGPLTGDLTTAAHPASIPTGGASATHSHEPQALVRFLGTGPYRPLAFIAYGLVGMLIARISTRSSHAILSNNAVPLNRGATTAPRGGRLLAAGLVLLALMLTLLIAPNMLGHGVHAYDGTALETLGNTAGAAGIILTLWGITTIPAPTGVDGIGEIVVAPLEAMGRASLTLYTLQILLLRLWFDITGTPDDAWIVMVGLIVLLALTAVLWQALARRRVRLPDAPTWKRRLADGPLEGLVTALSH